MQHLQKTGGYILQAQSFLPASASTTFRRFALRPPNSPALLLYFLSSVHSSNFRIPQVFYLPLLRKLPGVTQQFPFRNSSPRRVLLTSLLPFFIASCLPELIDTQREAAYLSAPMESFAPPPMRNKFLAAAILAATIAIAASLLAGAQMLPLPALVPTLLRWLAILLIAAYATSRRSLTTWIFVGLLAGAEFGHDWPSIAVNLQLLGTIFLRLIKVIIAPLLFGVLVVC